MGAIFKYGEPFSNTIKTRQLKQAEYDALSVAEKCNNTFYFITDTNGDEDAFQPVIYSDDEREIGVWCDGKPLYTRIIDITSVSFSRSAYNDYYASVDLSAYLSNIDMFFVDVTASAYYMSNYPRSFRRWTFDNANNTPRVELYIEANRNNMPVKLAVCYTKTTDQPGSGTWTPQGVPALHYSTEEQIVGTWIDGSTVYEKTFQISSLPQADNLIEHGISNLGKVVKYWGSAYCNALSNVPIPLVSPSAAQYIIHIYSFTSTVFHLERGTLYTGDNALSDITVTMQYTKSSSQGGN